MQSQCPGQDSDLTDLMSPRPFGLKIGALACLLPNYPGVSEDPGRQPALVKATCGGEKE